MKLSKVYAVTAEGTVIAVADTRDYGETLASVHNDGTPLRWDDGENDNTKYATGWHSSYQIVEFELMGDSKKFDLHPHKPGYRDMSGVSSAVGER